MAGFDTSIPDPKVGMEIIMKGISKFNFDLFQYALRYKHYDEEKLIEMAKHIAKYREKLEIEHQRLTKFAYTFNRSFVTDNNKCFDTALKLLRKLRSGISEVKKIYKSFCPRWGKRYSSYQAKTKGKLSAFEYSYFNEKEFQLSFFGLEDAPTCIQELYKEISRFFFQLNLSINLCMRVISDEVDIKNNPQYCNYLYNQFKEETLNSVADLIMLMSSDSEFLSPKKNPAIKSLLSYSSTEAWAPHGFHNYSKQEVKHLVIKEALEAQKNKNIDLHEQALFGDEYEKIEHIKIIIYHFDELLPENYNRKKLDARYIVFFMKWCGVGNDKTDLFLNFFKKHYLKINKRSHEVVNKSAVCTARTKLLREDKDEQQYMAFVQKINDMKIIPIISNKIAQ